MLPLNLQSTMNKHAILLQVQQRLKHETQRTLPLLHGIVNLLEDCDEVPSNCEEMAEFNKVISSLHSRLKLSTHQESTQQGWSAPVVLLPRDRVMIESPMQSMARDPHCGQKHLLPRHQNQSNDERSQMVGFELFQPCVM